MILGGTDCDSLFSSGDCSWINKDSKIRVNIVKFWGVQMIRLDFVIISII